MKYIAYILFLFTIILGTQPGFSQWITYENLPSRLQLFPRDEQDSARVWISGTVDTTGFDSIIVKIYRTGDIWKRMSRKLDYPGNPAPFSFFTKIVAGLYNYSFEVLLKKRTTLLSDTLIKKVVCGDVYFINGQSNAMGRLHKTKSKIRGDAPSEWVRSFGNSQQNKYNDSDWYLASGRTSRPGAVGIWGLHLGNLISLRQKVPVCIIQQAFGGEALSYFLSGIGGDTLPNRSNFDRLLIRATNAGLEKDVKAIFWWQGEADTDDTTNVKEYKDKFLTLYNGWKTYFPNIQKIYTTQIHPGYGKYADQLREIQREIASENNDIEIITPHNCGYFDGFHFGVPGYYNYAEKLYCLVARDFYGSTDTVDIEPPDIQNAYFTSSEKNVLVLQFENAEKLTFRNDKRVGFTRYFMKDHFYFRNKDGTIDTAIVDSITAYKNKLRLSLKKSSLAERITYLPSQYYNPMPGVPDTTYDGPWIENTRGVAALTFYQFPIDTLLGDDPFLISQKNFLPGAVKER